LGKSTISRGPFVPFVGVNLRKGGNVEIKEEPVINHRTWIGVLALAVAVPAVAQQPQSAVGRIKVASGSAFVMRAGALVPAQAGQMIFEADSLKTGADGRLGVTLKDDTRVSLSPGSEVRVDRFMFAPVEGRMGLVLNVVRGVMAYVSGRIAKLAPDSIRLETPAAVVGVRGTRLALRVAPE
jgi:hypothetical protein